MKNTIENLSYLSKSLSNYKATVQEKKFTIFLVELIEKLKHGDINFKSGDDWSNWVNEEMEISFENEICESCSADTIQDVFSDRFYSAMQDVRNSYEENR